MGSFPWASSPRYKAALLRARTHMCALHGTWAIGAGAHGSAHGMPMTPRSGVSIRPGWGVGVVGGRRQRALEVKPCKGEAASV